MPLSEKSQPDPLAMPAFRWQAAPAAAPVLQAPAALAPKDLAFLAAGLGVLVLAPLAEYAWLGRDEAPALKPAFSERAAIPGLQDSPAPIEEGINGIAQGLLVGENKGRVTPNTAADPLKLITRIEEDRPPAQVSTAPAPEVRKEEPSGWKDVLESAKNAAKAAASKAPGLPKPPKEVARQMRALAAATGGAAAPAASSSAATLQLAPPSSKGLVSVPRPPSSVHPIQAHPDFRGSASRGLAGGAGNPGAYRDIAGLRGPGGFLNDLSPSGLHGRGIDGALASGTGRPSNGEATAFHSGNGKLHDMRAVAPNKTEDLNALRQKLELQKSIDLKWDIKNYDELGRQKMEEQILVQTLAQTAQQAFLKVLDKLLNPQGKNQQAAAQQ